MKVIRNLVAAIAAAAVLLAAGTAGAADPKKPDGTVSIDETQFAVILGGSVGGGKLNFKGKTYDFKIGGVTAGGNVGVSKISATGEVFDPKDIKRFPGVYSKLDASAAFGPGVGTLYLKNENGVVMRLKSKSEGVQLNIGSASSVEVRMQ